MRPGITWVIVGAVAVIVVFAGLDALRSAGGEPTPSEASATGVTTTRTEPDRSPEQEIERIGNRWARLFAAGDRHWPAPGTCQYMTQPGCERISCERVGARPIENCTRPSWAFRKSFADATVTAIVIKGRQVAARFSNGETVEFTEIGVSGSYWIHKVGGNAGRKLFANEPG